MALPATHIRFAAAVADRLTVSDWGAYLTGTLYPDSRWVTGIDRRQTHDPHFLEPDFATDDFTLGWHIHCLCDHIQSGIHHELLEGLSELTPDDQWVRLAAAKVIQDMNDASEGQLETHLPLLGDCRTPNGESAEAVDAYLGFVRRAYREHTTPQWADYERLWAAVGLDRQRVVQIERQADRIGADKVLVSRLDETFARMVVRWMSDHERTLRNQAHTTVCGFERRHPGRRW